MILRDGEEQRDEADDDQNGKDELVAVAEAGKALETVASFQHVG